MCIYDNVKFKVTYIFKKYNKYIDKLTNLNVKK